MSVTIGTWSYSQNTSGALHGHDITGFSYNAADGNFLFCSYGEDFSGIIAAPDASLTVETFDSTQDETQMGIAYDTQNQRIIGVDNGTLYYYDDALVSWQTIGNFYEDDMILSLFYDYDNNEAFGIGGDFLSGQLVGYNNTILDPAISDYITDACYVGNGQWFIVTCPTTQGQHANVFLYDGTSPATFISEGPTFDTSVQWKVSIAYDSDNNELILMGRDGDYAVASVSGLGPTPATNYVSNLSDGTNTYVILDEEAQRTSNLVTSVSSSSTDSQYPSAKLFYDTIVDIETILHNINSGSIDESGDE